MNEYRITKYNPLFRNKDGAYTAEDWTSVSDIGRSFNGVMLTEDAYLEVERNYIRCFVDLMNLANVSSLTLEGLEGDTKLWHDGDVFSADEVVLFSTRCLRELLWGRLESKNFYIHFGYDYYSYVGTELEYETVMIVCKEHSLYCEKQ